MRHLKFLVTLGEHTQSEVGRCASFQKPEQIATPQTIEAKGGGADRVRSPHKREGDQQPQFWTRLRI